eukprot:08615_1
MWLQRRWVEWRSGWRCWRKDTGGVRGSWRTWLPPRGLRQARQDRDLNQRLNPKTKNSKRSVTTSKRWWPLRPSEMSSLSRLPLTK